VRAGTVSLNDRKYLLGSIYDTWLTVIGDAQSTEESLPLETLLALVDKNVPVSVRMMATQGATHMPTTNVVMASNTNPVDIWQYKGDGESPLVRRVYNIVIDTKPAAADSERDIGMRVIDTEMAAVLNRFCEGYHLLLRDAAGADLSNVGDTYKEETVSWSHAVAAAAVPVPPGLGGAADVQAVHDSVANFLDTHFAGSHALHTLWLERDIVSVARGDAVYAHLHALSRAEWKAALLARNFTWGDRVQPVVGGRRVSDYVIGGILAVRPRPSPLAPPPPLLPRFGRVVRAATAPGRVMTHAPLSQTAIVAPAAAAAAAAPVAVAGAAGAAAAAAAGAV
jgi:hypothetical protein